MATSISIPGLTLIYFSRAPISFTNLDIEFEASRGVMSLTLMLLLRWGMSMSQRQRDKFQSPKGPRGMMSNIRDIQALKINCWAAESRFCSIIASQNHLGWKRSLRSLSSSINLTLQCIPLNYVPKHHVHMSFKFLSGSEDALASFASLLPSPSHLWSYLHIMAWAASLNPPLSFRPSGVSQVLSGDPWNNFFQSRGKVPEGPFSPLAVFRFCKNYQ